MITDVPNFTPNDFGHLHGQLFYTTTGTRPEVEFVKAQLAQVKAIKAKPCDVKLLNDAVRFIQSIPRGLKFPKLDRTSLKVCGYSDASFANNADLECLCSCATGLTMLVLSTMDLGKVVELTAPSFQQKSLPSLLALAKVVVS